MDELRRQAAVAAEKLKREGQPAEGSLQKLKREGQPVVAAWRVDTCYYIAAGGGGGGSRYHLVPTCSALRYAAVERTDSTGGRLLCEACACTFTKQPPRQRHFTGELMREVLCLLPRSRK